jgi:hypothetical protein
MPQLIKEQYEKIDAIFASAEEAWNNKESLYTQELIDSINNDQLYAEGILLEPVYPEWDQSTFTINICKLATSLAAYQAAKTYDTDQVLEYSALAGWNYLGRIVTDIE